MQIFGDSSRAKVAVTAVMNDAILNVASGEIVIEDWAFCGHRVTLLTGTHDVTRFGMERQRAVPADGRDIIVKRGAWIGSGAIVIGPCVIGEDAVVAAGAVVMHDVPPRAVVTGNPAKVVRVIGEEPTAVKSKKGAEAA